MNACSDPGMHAHIVRQILTQFSARHLSNIVAVEVRPWAYLDRQTGTVDECPPAHADGWGIYSRMANGPAWWAYDTEANEEDLAHRIAAQLHTTLGLDGTYNKQTRPTEGVKADEEQS